ncbi:MAG: phosphate signaling complex protein PhoU [Thermoplasmatota archaeon]
MTREFQEQLAKLDLDVATMAVLARSMLHDGLDALHERDAERASSVLTRAPELAQRDEAIESATLRLLMLHQPVARDLRRVAAILKIITYLNRIGRYGYDIAAATQDVPDAAVLKATGSLKGMGRNVERMLDSTLEAFTAQRDAPVGEVLALEEAVDAQRWAVWREALTYMLQDNRNIEAGAQVMMVARYLERCGDNIVKMVEKIHYAATGERVVLT